MSQPAPAKTVDKSAARHAVLASAPWLQLLAGILAGGVAWTTINLPAFPRYYTELEIARRQAADNGGPSNPGATGTGVEGGRQRGEGRRRGGGNAGGEGEQGGPGDATQDRPSADAPAADGSADDTSEETPAESSAAPTDQPPADSTEQSGAAPQESTEAAERPADDCQPPSDGEPAADDAPADDPASGAAASGDPIEALPAREDLSADAASSAESAPPAGAEDAPTAPVEGAPPEGAVPSVNDLPAVDPDEAYQAALEANPDDPEAALQEQRVQQMFQEMQRRGNSPAGMGMGMAMMGGMGGMAAAPPPLTPAQVEEARIADTKNGTIAIGFFGMLLCGLIGLVEGISRKSLVAPLVGLLLGAFLGAVGGGLAGMAGKYIYYIDFKETAHEYLQQHPTVAEVRPILEGMLLYGAMWAILGVAAGLTVSLLSRRPRVIVRSVIGATLGGLLAGLAYATLEAVIFPLEAEGLVIPRAELGGSLWIVDLPEGINGWLWAIIPAGMIALLGCWQGRVPAKSSALKIRNPATA